MNPEQANKTERKIKMSNTLTPQQKAAQTKARNKQAKFEAAEEAAKAEIKRLGYGPRFYAGKCHAIEGLKDGETYYQEQFPGGYDSWQETLEALQS
jgi:hypothetical protein